MAEDVHARLRIGLVGGQRGEDDARGAEHDRHGPGPLDADAERAGGAVARARGDRDAGGGARRETSGDSSTRGSHAAVELQRLEHGSSLQRALGDVEQQRARRVGDVDRALAAEPQPHVVLGQQHVRDARVEVRLVRAQPQQLGRGEARQRAVAGQRDQPLEPDALLDLLALGGRALVVPEDRGAEHAPGGVERDEAVHLARQPDAGDLVGGRARRAPASLPAHQSSGILPAPARPRDARGRTGLSARATTVPSAATASALTPVVLSSSPTATAAGKTRPNSARVGCAERGVDELVRRGSRPCATAPRAALRRRSSRPPSR